MANSRDIAGLVGPVLIALSASEAANLDVWAENTVAGVYFNGAMLFVAGLAIVRAHNIWERSWTLLITTIGWGTMLLGLFRMFAPYYHLAEAMRASQSLIELTAPLMIGVYLTWQAYRRR